MPKELHWKIGILGGMLCETLMILVIVWAPNIALGVDIVSKIGIPMIAGSVCIGFIVLLVQSVEGKKRPAPRGANWRWISPIKRCRCFAR
ncbi:LytS/YhcK type 5TM receptor domain-containing protein [Escherichia coli]